jgi:hypothetical protein
MRKVVSCSDPRRRRGCSASICACRRLLVISSLTSNRVVSTMSPPWGSEASQSETAVRASAAAAVVGVNASSRFAAMEGSAQAARRAFRAASGRSVETL